MYLTRTLITQSQHIRGWNYNGRDERWKENRKKHNRRVCYEFARFYSKAINELLEENSEYEAFMLGDKTNLHYVVGLTGKDYSAILDLDNFNSLKDLARLKLGLTIKGINILRDDTGRLQKAINEFNKDKLKEFTDKYFNKMLRE